MDDTKITFFMIRQLQILRKNGIFGDRDIFTKKFAGWFDKIIFHRVNRTKYVDGWGQDKDEYSKFRNPLAVLEAKLRDKYWYHTYE